MTSTPPNTTRPTDSVHFTRWLAVGSLLGLILLCVLWETVIAPVKPNGSWLAIKALPLCVPLAGLLKNRMYTYRWVSLMVWLYFTEGVVRAYSDRRPSSYMAMIEILLCVLLFVACALHVRLRLRNAKQAQKRDAELNEAASRDFALQESK